ncbi:MAG: hypothetical protein LBC63_09065 [Holophagales bacterium]|jgi:hypothetical protein|nr:hypothetical protein [Holophagales bacterium]
MMQKTTLFATNSAKNNIGEWLPYGSAHTLDVGSGYKTTIGLRRQK